MRVPLSQPMYPGGQKFYGDVPANQAVFAYSELCASEDPEAALAPVPSIAAKQWYNTYLYLPQERRANLEGGQFFDRFVQGIDGEWLDVPKARRMAGHFQEQQVHAQRAKAVREAILAGAGGWAGTGLGRALGLGGHDDHDASGFSAGPVGMPSGVGGAGRAGPGGTTHQRVGVGFDTVGQTGYQDPYSAQPLVAYHGKLLPMDQLMAEHNVALPAWQSAVGHVDDWDFANLRCPWPFGRPYRNKQVSGPVYENFDRRSPYIPTDQSYKILNFASSFVDEQQYHRWR